MGQTFIPAPEPATAGGAGATEAGPGAPLGRGGLLLFAGAALAVPLLFALYTGHIQDDFFIVFRHSQNLVEGHGLVYQPGERVHGFTSPLGALLAALCLWATGGTSYLAALWVFRLLSAAAFAGGGVFFLKALRAGGSGRYVSIAFAALYLLDYKAVDFSMNGMETGFMLLFLGWAIYLLTRDEPRHWPAAGLAWAGLMWTRPDGCVYIAVLSLAGLLFATGPRRPRLLALAKSAAVCAAVYLPWFVGAWSYYGSPVPHSIQAKSNYGPGYHDWAQTVVMTLERFPERVARVFQPTNNMFGGWFLPYRALNIFLGLFCAGYCLLRVNDRLGRMASFCFALLGLYVSFLTFAFAWYLPPVAVCGYLALTRGGAACARALAGRWARAGRLASAGVPCLIAVNLLTFSLATWEVGIRQKEIEWGQYALIGRWLKDNVREGEGVYVEPLGYVGYFSGAKILDYPGIVSPEVVRAARQRPNDFASLGLRLKPEWMVLRYYEVPDLERHEEFARHYTPVKLFDVNDRIDGYAFLPGQSFVRVDARFTVFRRVPDEVASSGGPDQPRD